MKAYRTKSNKLPGTAFRDLRKKADAVYSHIKKQSKRRVYVRSAYFNKEKVSSHQKFLMSVFPN